MNGILALLAGLGSAFGVAWLYQNNQSFRQAVDSARERVRHGAASATETARDVASTAAVAPSVDLNSCTREDLMHLGLSEEVADRVLENRPYRNRLDLVARFVVPEDVYETIKHAVGVDDGSAKEPVKVAS